MEWWSQPHYHNVYESRIQLTKNLQVVLLRGFRRWHFTHKSTTVEGTLSSSGFHPNNSVTDSFFPELPSSWLDKTYFCRSLPKCTSEFKHCKLYRMIAASIISCSFGISFSFQYPLWRVDSHFVFTTFRYSKVKWRIGSGETYVKPSRQFYFAKIIKALDNIIAECIEDFSILW